MSCAYRAVVFDFFGTLTQAVRRGPAHDAIARRLGCEPHALVRALDATFLERSVGALGDAATALGTAARLAGGNPSQSTLEAVLPDRVAAVRADIRLRPEATGVLAWLRRSGLSTAIVSDCGPELPELLPTLAVAPLVEATVLSIEVGHRKPDPIMYVTACERLDVSPEDCLYVGDGGSRELTGAVAVGMSAVRLDAPDLHDHLVFDVDTAWSGPQIGCLIEVFGQLREESVARRYARTSG